MKKPSSVQIHEFDYHLPDDRIAKHPLIERDESKLLLYEAGKVNSYKFNDLPDLLQRDDRLIFNSTRVIRARLEFLKPTGARIEIFLLHPEEPSDYSIAFSSSSPVVFSCLLGNAKKWKNGPVYLDRNDLTIEAEKLEQSGKNFNVRFSWNNPDLSFSEVLEIVGSVPIPPYLNREAQSEDVSDYQTVYAQEDGSVAAPTAGLHFTDTVLEKISNKGIRRGELVLHVGAGTFVPVKIDNAMDHPMHAEQVTVKRELIEGLLRDDRIIAVGTTSTRSLESLYWIGLKIARMKTFNLDSFTLDQWEAYDLAEVLSVKESLQIILEHIEHQKKESISFQTRIMITPGYEFKMIDGLITNFHQPKSTLLLLIAAIVGDDWKRIYQYALENDFRFLSYGDSSLIFRR